MTKPMILGVGAPFVDIIIHVEETFLSSRGLVKGSVTFGSPQEFQNLLRSVNTVSKVCPGGSCANVIRGLAALGWPCSLVGKIGDDAPGRWLLEDLQNRGISHYYTNGSQGTSQAICCVTPDGERTMFDYLGASDEMRGNDLSPKLFTARRLVHIEGYSLLQESLTERAMVLAKEAGVMISFDLANFNIVNSHRDQIEKLLVDYISVVFANSAEASALTGLEPEGACRWLAQRCQCAVVTLGPHGCFVASGDAFHHCRAIPVPSVIDTTGAGDLFASGFLDGWLRNCSLEHSATQGSILAAEVIQQEGPVIPITSWPLLKQRLAS